MKLPVTVVFLLSCVVLNLAEDAKGNNDGIKTYKRLIPADVLRGRFNLNYIKESYIRDKTVTKKLVNPFFHSNLKPRRYFLVLVVTMVIEKQVN